MFSRLRKCTLNILVVVIAFCISACSSNGENLSIEAFLELESKKDVVDCFGEPISTESYDHYDVIFMDNNFSMLVDYDEETLESISLTYYFIGMQDVEMAMDMISYEPSSDDISKAEIFVEELVSTFTGKYGEPDIFNSPVSTTTYTWIVDDCEIEVQNNINNEQLSLIGAIDVRIEY